VAHRAAFRRQRRKRLVLLGAGAGGLAFALGILGALALRWPA
jgi:hypothetical protein